MENTGSRSLDGFGCVLLRNHRRNWRRIPALRWWKVIVGRRLLSSSVKLQSTYDDCLPKKGIVGILLSSVQSEKHLQWLSVYEKWLLVGRPLSPTVKVKSTCKVYGKWLLVCPYYLSVENGKHLPPFSVYKNWLLAHRDCLSVESSTMIVCVYGKWLSVVWFSVCGWEEFLNKFQPKQRTWELPHLCSTS